MVMELFELFNSFIVSIGVIAEEQAPMNKTETYLQMKLKITI